MQFEQRYGKAEPRERAVEILPPNTIDYWTQVKPVLDQRCVVCHACFDAPCQLNMSSIEGIERGASAAKVYKSMRLTAAPLTRLFEDAQSVVQWRTKEFHPVLNEYADTPEVNREAGVMYRSLQLKEQNPLPNIKRLSDNFDLSLNQRQFCAKSETFDRFAKKHPYWGMPYALPGLPTVEQDTLKRWLEQGAFYTIRPSMPSEYLESIERWEKFFNGDSLKEQLVSRYIFEHLYFAHLNFPDVDGRKFFTLVRSATPSGEPIRLIATRRPYNDPEVERVYYRFQEMRSSIVAKTHMPYSLDDQRMKRWHSLFVEKQYDVEQLPSYEDKFASNPFQTFYALPIQSRYEFMLDEAQYTIMGFIKGTVCRGQVALDVINDNFWVFFTEPEQPQLEIYEEFLVKQGMHLELPAASIDIYRPIAHWRKYKKQQKEMLAAKDRFLAENFGESAEINLKLVWDGDGVNENAALTIFRHFDSATVEKGLLGQTPKTAWLIDYSLLERIHYLLVAGYDPYGNIGHQLVTRLYMDFLRMESEENFLLLLPESAQVRERDLWYQSADDEIKTYLTLPSFEKMLVTSIDYRSDDEKLELFEMLAQRLDKVLPKKYTMSAINNRNIRIELDRLHLLKGKSVTLMPEVAFVRITASSGDQYVTILNNRAHSNMTSMFKEHKNRLPNKDTLSVIPGFIGAYPNAFYVVDESQLSDFVSVIGSLELETDYGNFLDSYGVRRTDQEFWQKSDAIHLAFRKSTPLSPGLLDYNRLENR
ncbi:Fatty acid cis/trans isomerase [hydrothermal vent metagenome]|uniref:Fatty acid cis/trans isomerase n=1 Tax=hydrothermal vent metagenome TaxID=652676 RepID=A0A3B0Z473_9ZZZZ